MLLFVSFHLNRAGPIIFFVDRVAVGAIEAKPVGTILVDVEGQTESLQSEPGDGVYP